jgi:hypothetical protein
MVPRVTILRQPLKKILEGPRNGLDVMVKIEIAAHTDNPTAVFQPVVQEVKHALI